MILQDFHTHQSNLAESSGYSLAGSFTRDLIASKVWLLQELEQIQQHYTTMYILGSWYGNLGVLLALDPIIKYKKLINVETDQKFLQASRRIHNYLGIGNTEYMLADANTLNYRQLGRAGVVVNTSLTEMHQKEWFEHIPAGTLVAMQARNNDPGVAYHSSQDIQRRYPLNQVIYHGTMKLQDPETKYTRYMVIGRR